MISPLILTATMPVVSHSKRMTPGIIAWHRSKGVIVLDDVDGTATVDRIFCNTFVSEDNVLVRGDAYVVSGPFGQDDLTHRGMVQHSVRSHINVGPPPETHVGLARKARVSGIGTVKSATFEEGSCPAMPWNAIVVTTHNYYHPLRAMRIDFDVIYHFGLFTPLPHYWKDLAVGCRIWVNASLVAKDTRTSRYIAEVSSLRTAATVLCADFESADRTIFPHLLCTARRMKIHT